MRKYIYFRKVRKKQLQSRIDDFTLVIWMFILRIESVDDFVVSKIFEVLSLKAHRKQSNVLLMIKLCKSFGIYNISLHVID